MHFHLYLFDHNAADDGLIGTANADAGRTTAMNASSHRAATRTGHPEQRQRRRGAAAALASALTSVLAAVALAAVALAAAAALSAAALRV